MKKLALVLSFVFLFASVSYAQIPGGARLAAMGNAGTAVANDISSAYYNPAGLMSTNTRWMKLKIGAGAAMTGMNSLLALASQSTDLNTFMFNNFSNAIDANGTAGAFLGFEAGKFGLSVIAEGSLAGSKIANSANGSASAGVNYDVVLTMGTTLNLPMLPMGFADVGLNLKQVNQINSSTAIVATTATYGQGIGTGYGIDLGLRTGLDTPIAPIAVGLVIKDLMETINTTTTSRIDTVDITDGSYTKGTATETTSSTPISSTVVIGAATQIPGYGTTVALDYASALGTAEWRLGLEQSIIPFFLTGRAGLISGTNTAKTTLGLGLDFLGSLNAAYIIDGKNSQDTVLIVDFTLGM